MTESILRINNLIKQYVDQGYPTDNGFRLEIPHLEFQKGKIYSLVGPNGAGKTTLLSLLNFLDMPDGGEIFFKQERVTEYNALDIRRKMSLIIENPFLFHASVFQNITLGLRLRSMDKKICKDRADAALKMVGLDGFASRYAYNLSRGEAQRVAIARAIALLPEMLFLDEPFTNIDRQNMQNLETLIAQIRERYDTTIIFTTHDLSQAWRLSDAAISLVNGKIVDGSLENFFTGEAREAKGIQFVGISPHIYVAALTEKKGKVHISIHPQDIILSNTLISSSARNAFKGIVKKIYLEGKTVRLNILVEQEKEFIALITKLSYESMKLSIGASIFLTFKATSVRVF